MFLLDIKPQTTDNDKVIGDDSDKELDMGP